MRAFTDMPLVSGGPDRDDHTLMLRRASRAMGVERTGAAPRSLSPLRALAERWASLVHTNRPARHCLVQPRRFVFAYSRRQKSLFPTRKRALRSLPVAPVSRQRRRDLPCGPRVPRAAIQTGTAGSRGPRWAGFQARQALDGVGDGCVRGSRRSHHSSSSAAEDVNWPRMAKPSA